MRPWSGAKMAAALLALAAAGLSLPASAASLSSGGRVAPPAPAFARWSAEGSNDGATRALGLVPAPVSGAGAPRVRFAPLMSRFPARFTPPGATTASAPRAVADTGSPTAAAGAPTSLDLRTLGRLTPVRDQGRFGTCWAFASLASLESSLLPGESRDLSENNLAARSGFDLGYDAGGNSYMAAAYLLRWDGPVNETDDPYAPYAAAPSPPTDGARVDLHVHEVLQLPARRSSSDNADLKWAVMTYGAVATTMHWAPSAYRSGPATYCSSDAGANHAVALVGWDDTFPATEFAGTPPGPGAFLVRNSWGDGFGDGGYFWVSYHDAAFGGQSAVFTGAEPAAEDERIYQHDPLGWVASYRPPGAADPCAAWFAVSYTPAETGTLTSAGFYTTAPNAEYEVRVADSVEEVGATPVCAAGVLAVPGYHTVALDEPAAVVADRPFVIAVRVRVPGYTYPVAIERPYAGYADAAAVAGQSYVSGDGVSWTDMTALIAATDVCLKGYGRATDEPAQTPAPAPTSSPKPETTPTPAPSPTPAPVADPVLKAGDSAGRVGAVVRVPIRVLHPDVALTADVRLVLRSRQGRILRRQTLTDVPVGGRVTWRLRAPARHGSYVVVAVAVLDTGQVSKKATATLRCR